MFTGFTDETIRFFLDIRFHNETSWFNANRARYESAVAAPFAALIEDLGPGMKEIEPAVELRPYKALARLRRDTRFSRDKSPYRDHLWVLFRKAGEPREGSLFYWFELGTQHIIWGMGVWGDNRPLFDAFRRRVAADPEGFGRVLAACGLEKAGLTPGIRSWSRMAVPPQIPLGLRGWYLMREFYISRENVPFSAAFDPALPQRILRDYRAMAPLYRYLRGILDEELPIPDKP